jgi:hypothetical protein
MTLGVQVTFDGERSAARNSLLDEVLGSFEGVVVAGFVIAGRGARRLEVGS